MCFTSSSEYHYGSLRQLLQRHKQPFKGRLNIFNRDFVGSAQTSVWNSIFLRQIILKKVVFHTAGVAKLFDPRAELATAWTLEDRIQCYLYDRQQPMLSHSRKRDAKKRVQGRSATSGGHFPPQNCQNIAKQFWHLQKLSKNKDEILYSNHF